MAQYHYQLVWKWYVVYMMLTSCILMKVLFKHEIRTKLNKILLYSTDSQQLHEFKSWIQFIAP